jgi:hypothetical protein
MKTVGEKLEHSGLRRNKMKGWYHISISKRNLAELERIGEQLREIGIEKEPRRKKEVSYDRIIQELINHWKEFHKKVI